MLKLTKIILIGLGLFNFINQTIASEPGKTSLTVEQKCFFAAVNQTLNLFYWDRADWTGCGGLGYARYGEIYSSPDAYANFLEKKEHREYFWGTFKNKIEEMRRTSSK